MKSALRGVRGRRWMTAPDRERRRACRSKVSLRRISQPHEIGRLFAFSGSIFGRACRSLK